MYARYSVHLVDTDGLLHSVKKVDIGAGYVVNIHFHRNGRQHRPIRLNFFSQKRPFGSGEEDGDSGAGGGGGVVIFFFC